MRFNTPDNILLDDKTVLHWTDKDAIPFFILQNGKIIKCTSGITHNDYIESVFKDKNKQRTFINSVALQGRFWTKSNVFAFWYIDDNADNKIKYTVKKLSKSPYTSKIYYNHKIYQLKIDKESNFEWLQAISVKPNKTDNPIDDEKKKIIEYWFKSTLDFIKNNYLMSEKIGNHLRTRNLNNYELLAATCYQIWADFFMNPNSKFNKFTLDDFILFIDLKYHGRVSVLELFNYFHQSMRKKMIVKYKEDEYLSIKMQPDNEFEELMTDYNFSDSEYTIINYEDTDKPYSCNVKTEDYDKAYNITNSLKNSEFIVDRLTSRKIDDNIKLYSFRIRKKVNFNNMKNTIRLTESKLHNLISETVQKILKEYGDFDDVPLSSKNHKLPSYGDEPVTDYFREKYENAKKDNSPMGYFKFRFYNPFKRNYMIIKSISYKKLQCLKNDLEEKFGEKAQCSEVLPCKPFSDDVKNGNNIAIEWVYNSLLGDK